MSCVCMLQSGHSGDGCVLASTLCVALLMCLFVLCVACFTVFVNYLVKQFAMCLSVVAILLLNVMDVFSVCASKYSFHMFCLCFCMSEVISPFRSLRAGSQVNAFLMIFLCVILHTMSSGKSLQLLCILPFGMLCLSAISMFVKILLAVRMLVGMVV